MNSRPTSSLSLASGRSNDEWTEGRAKLKHVGVCDKGGFFDSVNVGSGKVSRYHLALDQGMVMVAAANALGDDRLQTYFAEGKIKSVIQPLIAQAQFTAGP